MTSLLPAVRDELVQSADARARRGRRRRRVRFATAATATLAVLTVAWPSDRLDSVARAREALTPPAGEIIHTVVDREVDAPGRLAHASETVEGWSASDPTRWRVVVGSVQTVYRNGTQTSARAGEQPVTVPATEPGVLPPGLSPFAGAPVAEIRALLAAGRLRDAGVRTIEGRVIRRLEGQTQSKLGDSVVRLDVIYDVAPDSYEPVEVQAKQPGVAVAVTLRFLRFERLPATVENTRLLDIQEPVSP